MLTWIAPKGAKSRDGPLSRVGNDGTEAPPRTHLRFTCRFLTRRRNLSRSEPPRSGETDTATYVGANPTIVKAILRVLDREDYWWVECSTFEGGWQVPHYTAQSDAG